MHVRVQFRCNRVNICDTKSPTRQVEIRSISILGSTSSMSCYGLRYIEITPDVHKHMHLDLINKPDILE
jgi:hypothetical protein